MLGLELVPLLLQFVPPFDAFLRGHEWEISHGSNHGRVVVEGEMQRHRARAPHGSIGVPVTRLVHLRPSLHHGNGSSKFGLLGVISSLPAKRVYTTNCGAFLTPIWDYFLPAVAFFSPQPPFPQRLRKHCGKAFIRPGPSSSSFLSNFRPTSSIHSCSTADDELTQRP